VWGGGGGEGVGGGGGGGVLNGHVHRKGKKRINLKKMQKRKKLREITAKAIMNWESPHAVRGLFVLHTPPREGEQIKSWGRTASGSNCVFSNHGALTDERSGAYEK